MRNLYRLLLWPTISLWEWVDNRPEPKRMLCFLVAVLPGPFAMGFLNLIPKLGIFFALLFFYSICGMMEWFNIRDERNEIIRRIKNDTD